jgi:hypothetical protein
MIVLAQQDINPQEILFLLGINAPPGPIWNIMMYIIFFLALITMLMQSDKTLLPTLCMAAVLAAVVIDKLRVMENAPPLYGQPGLWTFLLHCVMFAVPLIVAGMTKAPKSRGPAILCGIIGGIYLFGYWVFVQNR